MRHLRTRLVTGGIVLLFAVAWLVAGPARLGGSTTYVATHGISMEPRFHTGDLALVRPASAYRVGDVVAYALPTLKIMLTNTLPLATNSIKANITEIANDKQSVMPAYGPNELSDGDLDDLLSYLATLRGPDSGRR